MQPIRLQSLFTSSRSLGAWVLMADPLALSLSFNAICSYISLETLFPDLSISHSSLRKKSCAYSQLSCFILKIFMLITNFVSRASFSLFYVVGSESKFSNHRRPVPSTCHAYVARPCSSFIPAQPFYCSNLFKNDLIS